MTIHLGRQTVILGILIAFWLAVTGILLASWGNPEGFLLHHLGRYSRDDAFKHLNNDLPSFWLLHSFLVLAAMAAARFRRTDVLVVLLIGPAFVLTLNLFYQDWSDPNWSVFVGLDAIGWLVSTIVGGTYWAMRPSAPP